MNDTSTNLSKIKREHLLNICSKIKKGETVDITEVTELEQFVKSMKYGLIFEEHEEPIDVKLRTHIPVFKEFKEVMNNPDSSDCNFLLEGDNLHSLKLLERTHKGKIDVIYIDPPYNTLNDDFAYGDKMLDNNDGFIHSKWLSFMKERLDIARKLLTPKGMIFISIDDNENANLRLLCDTIFGEDNFVANIVLPTTSGVNGPKSAHVRRTIVKVKEYLLVYAKNKSGLDLEPIKIKNDVGYDTHYNIILDKDLNKISVIEYFKNIQWIVEEFKKYDLKLSVSNIASLVNKSEKFKDYLYFDLAERLYRSHSLTMKIEDDSIFDDGKIHIINNTLIEKKSTGSYGYLLKLADRIEYADEYLKEKTWTLLAGDLWTGFEKDMGNIGNEGGVAFKNGKKPIRLLKRILRLINNKNACVLDFFCGSGSIGEATLEMNKEDDGNRHFILCTNNEVSSRRCLDYIHDKGYMLNYKPNKDVKNNTIQSKIDNFFKDNPHVHKELMIDNKLEYETYGICQSVTFPRLNTVITGIKPDGSKYSDGIKSNFHYFQTDMIDKGNDDLDEILYEASFCLAKIEHMATIDGEIVVVADCDEDIDNIIDNSTDKLKAVFVADDVLLDARQKEFFDRHKIEIKQIPNYYYKEV